MTPLIDKLVTRGITRLEQVCDYIISTHIALEKAQGRHQTGNPYRMRIDIRIPDRADIVVSRTSMAAKKIPDGIAQLQTVLSPETETELDRPELVGRNLPRRRGTREEPLQALIRRTFNSARRQLEKEVDKQRGDKKTPAQQETQAVIEKIFREKGYGFLRTMDGEQLYFHQNSVLHNHWQSLALGTIVRYTLEVGEKGLQASTVEPVDKPGVAELHDKLHDLS